MRCVKTLYGSDVRLYPTVLNRLCLCNMLFFPLLTSISSLIWSLVVTLLCKTLISLNKCVLQPPAGRVHAFEATFAKCFGVSLTTLCVHRRCWKVSLSACRQISAFTSTGIFFTTAKRSKEPPKAAWGPWQCTLKPLTPLQETRWCTAATW